MLNLARGGASFYLDAAMARRALDQITTAEAAPRAGGHIPHADHFAGQLRSAEALVASLAE